MYRMFTGRFANQGLPKAGEGSGKKLVPMTKLNPKVPAALNEVVLACLEYGPDRRPKDMFEVAQQLAAIAKTMGLEDVDLKGADDED
jgi:serine/threonine-protein kinase